MTKCLRGVLGASRVKLMVPEALSTVLDGGSWKEGIETTLGIRS